MVFRIFSLMLLLCLLMGCAQPRSVLSDPLDGTSWKLFAYRKTLPIEGSTITAKFENGRISGNASCNTYQGSYALDGASFDAEELISTLMACADPALMEQERVYLMYLEDAQTYRLEGNRLYLRTSYGEELTFDREN